MSKRAQIKWVQKIANVSGPISRTVSSKTLTAREWRKDLLVSWIFQTCIRLQTSMDRRFLKYGLTQQEASVLLRCVETRRITSGKLAVALGRDKGKITRFVDRLEVGGLVMRDTDRRDRRCSVLKPTAKGKKMARELFCVFDSIRKELFVGIGENDVRRVSGMLSELHKNAARIGTRQRRETVGRRRRIGTRGKKAENARVLKAQPGPDYPVNGMGSKFFEEIPLEEAGARPRLSTGLPTQPTSYTARIP
jgi:MarR family transcriptional regulator for hemolysin